MGKHTLILEPDYDFVLIAISSHEKDYRIGWALNNKLNIELIKIDPLEIKGKRQTTPSFFSCFEFIDEDNFTEYFVLKNRSEGKSPLISQNNLFNDQGRGDSSVEKDFLIPEYKQMNFFLIIKGELTTGEIQELVKKIKEIDLVNTAVVVDVKGLKSKHNLIF